MADPHSRAGGDRLVDLRLDLYHWNFLKDAVGACLMGLRHDLARKEPHPNRERAEHEEAAYERLLDGVRNKRIAPDAEVIEVASALADSVDTGNEYAQAAFEHRAFCSLLAQLTEGASR